MHEHKRVDPLSVISLVSAAGATAVVWWVGSRIGDCDPPESAESWALLLSSFAVMPALVIAVVWRAETSPGWFHGVCAVTAVIALLSLFRVWGGVLLQQCSS